mmetsp:Transcript_30994/g.51610  ORF Transcript_30994/g.51610 Transcript_30994/m.51610 type:complete len:106 (-) Transcript_30994:1252-1569(-)
MYLKLIYYSKGIQHELLHHNTINAPTPDLLNSQNCVDETKESIGGESLGSVETFSCSKTRKKFLSNLEYLYRCLKIVFVPSETAEASTACVSSAAMGSKAVENPD